MPAKNNTESSTRIWSYTSHRFGIQIDSVEVAYFTECSPLVITTDVKEHIEGGLNTFVHKLPIRTRYDNITLKHGIDEGQDLFRWYLRTLNEPQPDSGESASGTGSYRRHMSIVMYDPLGEIVRRWDMQNAFPVKWTGPDLRAENASPAIETVEIAHSGLVIRSTS